jgi:hypothetical protein
MFTWMNVIVLFATGIISALGIVFSRTVDRGSRVRSPFSRIVNRVRQLSQFGRFAFFVAIANAIYNPLLVWHTRQQSREATRSAAIAALHGVGAIVPIIVLRWKRPIGAPMKELRRQKKRFLNSLWGRTQIDVREEDELTGTSMSLESLSRLFPGVIWSRADPKNPFKVIGGMGFGWSAKPLPPLYLLSNGLLSYSVPPPTEGCVALGSPKCASYIVGGQISERTDYIQIAPYTKLEWFMLKDFISEPADRIFATLHKGMTVASVWVEDDASDRQQIESSTARKLGDDIRNGTVCFSTNDGTGRWIVVQLDASAPRIENDRGTRSIVEDLVAREDPTLLLSDSSDVVPDNRGLTVYIDPSDPASLFDDSERFVPKACAR